MSNQRNEIQDLIYLRWIYKYTEFSIDTQHNIQISALFVHSQTTPGITQIGIGLPSCFCTLFYKSNKILFVSYILQVTFSIVICLSPYSSAKFLAMYVPLL